MPRRRSTPSSRSSRRRLSRGGEINFTGFGKFSVADRGARQGVNPQTGERIQIAASRVPALQRRIGPEEGRQGLTPPSSRRERPRRAQAPSARPPEASLPSPTGWPPSSRSGAARSSSVSTPIPPPCGRSRSRPCAVARAVRAELTGAAVELHCRAAIEAVARPRASRSSRSSPASSAWARPASRRSQAVVAAAHEAGLLVIADGKRGDVPVTARAYAQALVGSTPGPFGEVPGLGADAFTANPLLGRDALEPLVEAARAAGACCFAAGAHLQPRARPTCRICRRQTGRCTSGWPRSSHELGVGARETRPLGRRGGHRRHRARRCSAGCAS